MANQDPPVGGEKGNGKPQPRFFDRFSNICGVPAGWLEIGFRVLLLGLTVASGLILWFQISTYESQRQLTRDHLRLSSSFRELAVSQSEQLLELTARIGSVEKDAIVGLKEQSESVGLTRKEISDRVNDITRNIDTIIRDMSQFGAKLDGVQANLDNMNSKHVSQFEDAYEKWAGVTADQQAIREELTSNFARILDERCKYGAWLDSQHIESVVFYSIIEERARDRFVNMASTLGVSIGYGDCGAKFLFAPVVDPNLSVLEPRLRRLAQDLGAELVHITPAGPM